MRLGSPIVGNYHFQTLNPPTLYKCRTGFGTVPDRDGCSPRLSRIPRHNSNVKKNG